MGKTVTLGEVVADVYREDAPSEVELPFTARPGGAPANVAVAAAKLGAEAAFVGRLDDDLFGDFVFGALEAVGVETSAILRQPTRTTLAFVEVAPDGDREFTFYRSVPAADELLSPNDISHETLSGASSVNFGSIPLLQDPARSAARAFDVNLRERLWKNTETARQQISPMLDLAKVAKLSDDELPPVLGVQSPTDAADALLDRGVALVVVSMGDEGAFYATRGFRDALPGFEIDDEGVADATGAGDAFLAAVLVHLSESPGWESDEAAVREAVHRGTAAGALACTDYGAMRALPSREDLERLVAIRGSPKPKSRER